MANITIKKIAVIGAGVAGLGAARLLSQAGFECDIFEKGEKAGGQWVSGYHTYGLQTPKSLYEIPDYPMPETYPRVPSGEELQAYFESYAKDFKIFDKIRFNTEIISLEQQTDNTWVVRWKEPSGQTHSQNYDFVVVASGIYFEPFIPEIPGKDNYKGEIKHSSKYLTPDSVRHRKIAVVGFGKSALDVAGDAAKYAQKVSLVFRKSHWPIPMDVLEFLDVRRIYLTRLACAFLPLYQRPQNWMKTLHGKFPWLVKGFWRFTEAVIKFQYPLKACGVLPEESIEIDIFNLDFLPRKEVYQLMRQGKIENRQGHIKEFTETGIRLESGEVIECDTVIFGTGYRTEYGFLPEAFKKSKEDDGVYLYRHILHPDLPNLAFIGRAATFSNSLTSHLAAVWLVNLLKGVFKLPGREQMLKEIQAIKDWKRSFMPPLSSRATVIKLHMTHFHDELLSDFGANPYRKKNRLLEWVQDYRPADYRELLMEVGRRHD